MANQANSKCPARFEPHPFGMTVAGWLWVYGMDVFRIISECMRVTIYTILLYIYIIYIYMFLWMCDCLKSRIIINLNNLPWFENDCGERKLILVIVILVNSCDLWICLRLFSGICKLSHCVYYCYFLLFIIAY